MQTHITLELDRQLIRRAQVYAQQQGKSLSQLVTEYLARLLPQDEQVTSSPEATPLPPITQSLRGILRGVQGDEHAYHAYLEQKYL